MSYKSQLASRHQSLKSWWLRGGTTHPESDPASDRLFSMSDIWHIGRYATAAGFCIGLLHGGMSMLDGQKEMDACQDLLKKARGAAIETNGQDCPQRTLEDLIASPLVLEGVSGTVTLRYTVPESVVQERVDDAYAHYRLIPLLDGLTCAALGAASTAVAMGGLDVAVRRGIIGKKSV